MIDPPTNIRALQSERVLELVWEDGVTDRLPYRFLRGRCPCASCVNEITGERVVGPEAIDPDVRPEGMAPVGSYAVKLVWSDGHSTGLFTWDRLRSLGREAKQWDGGP